MTPNSLLDTNAEGLHLIMRWEGFRSQWYLCPAKVWTIGYGLTEPMAKRYLGISSPRKEIGEITQLEGEKLLQGILLSVFEPAVERALDHPQLSNRFSALVSFCYNVGIGAFKRSTLLRLVNEARYAEAAEQFGRWVYVKGKVYEGLVKRRKDEATLFMRSSPPATQIHLSMVETLPVVPIPHSRIGVTRKL